MRNPFIRVRVLPYRDLRMTWAPQLDQSAAKNAVNRYHLDFVSPIYYGLTFERANLPVNRRKVCVWFDWRERSIRTVDYYSSHLRDYPLPKLTGILTKSPEALTLTAPRLFQGLNNTYTPGAV